MTKVTFLLSSVLLSIIGYYMESVVFGLFLGIIALFAAAYDSYKNKLDLFNCLALIFSFTVVFYNFTFI